MPDPADAPGLSLTVAAGRPVPWGRGDQGSWQGHAWPNTPFSLLASQSQDWPSRCAWQSPRWDRKVLPFPPHCLGPISFHPPVC